MTGWQTGIHFVQFRPSPWLIVSLDVENARNMKSICAISLLILVVMTVDCVRAPAPNNSGSGATRPCAGKVGLPDDWKLADGLILSKSY